ncbi:MAG: Asp-tRNA(Asn)/Glu-tRNA(Gln) amidotransferase subunit GatC [Chloroflexi bacterium]|nr:Asp-tRNA(Asn)/Glu-tRNA(Gln) amidotransferase subunit GatC [Chloroflexota bacterium]
MTQIIDTKTVKHVAFLVRMGISDGEAQSFSQQFSAIIDFFNLLNEVDTHDTPPATQVIHANMVLREDAAQPSMPREDFLKNAPESEEGYVKVSTVLGEE